MRSYNSPLHLPSLFYTTNFLTSNSQQYPYILNKRSYSVHATRKRDSEHMPVYDIIDPLLNEKRESLSPIYLDDLNSYNRFTLLPEEDQKNIRKHVYGFKK